MTAPPRIRGVLTLLALAGACAHVEPPPGGPEDRDPPALLSSAPESLTVVTDLRAPVVLRFDERISEQGVRDAVDVSPRTSVVVVDRGFSSIRVSLRDGWEAGRIYHVTVASDVRDLFNNPLAAPIELVFSTGPAIPDTRFTGVVTERTTGDEGGDDVRVEAILAPDSLVYSLPVDSAGTFDVAHLPTGSYLVRAYSDVNRNRELDEYEARDSTRVELSASAPASATLSMVAPDSTAPRLAAAEVADSARVGLRFDDYVDPAQELAPTAVQISDSAGVSVAVARVLHGAASPAVARADTTGAAGTSAAGRPSQSLTVELAPGARLRPGVSYRVRAVGIRNLVGLAGDSETELEAPAAPPPPAAGAPPAAGQ